MVGPGGWNSMNVVDLLDKVAKHRFSDPLRPRFLSVSPRDQRESAVLLL
jgi:hypothetical protein